MQDISSSFVQYLHCNQLSCWILSDQPLCLPSPSSGRLWPTPPPTYLFAPFISALLLLQSAPFIRSTSMIYVVSCLLFSCLILILNIKIYGHWFTTKGKRFLSTVANPTSQLSVIGNLVGARAAAVMGWRESAMCMFALGMARYIVLFVTLYQRLECSGGSALPAMLRLVFFLFFDTV